MLTTIFYHLSYLDADQQRQIFYIGRTTKSLKQRLEGHLSERTRNTYKPSPKCKLMRALASEGITVEITEIERIQSFGEKELADPVEARLIREYREAGHDLTNVVIPTGRPRQDNKPCFSILRAEIYEYFSEYSPELIDAMILKTGADPNQEGYNNNQGYILQSIEDELARMTKEELQSLENKLQQPPAPQPVKDTSALTEAFRKLSEAQQLVITAQQEVLSAQQLVIQLLQQ